MSRTIPIGWSVCWLVACSLIACSLPGHAQDGEEKFLRLAGARAEGQYIVVFDGRSSSDATAGELAAAFSASVATTWDRTLQGALLIDLDEPRARALSRDPRVRWVEENGIATIQADQPTPPSWGLDRIDQRALSLDDNYHYDFAGQGVTVYILDTGIRISHQDFGARASWGTKTVSGPNEDCHGHGTHVAATVGGTEYGVAKGVDLVAVKVLDCFGNGTYAGIIEGIEWVTANAVQPAVANMSLGGPASLSLDLAVNNSAASGIVYAIAAANANTDACRFSPARAEDAITVGATTVDDQRSSFSNWGGCVDLFAPGSAITSAWHTSDTASRVLNGTSMAAPHVAGVAALIRQQYPQLGVGQVKTELRTRATLGAVDDARGSPDLLLHSIDSIGNRRLSIALEGLGFGTILGAPAGLECQADCSEFFLPGVELTLTATSIPGSSFVEWGGGVCSGSDPCTVTLDLDRVVTASFDAVRPLRGLAVVRDGDGFGVVTSSPPGVACGSDCAAVYGDGTPLTLTATASPGSTFAGWGGACSGSGPCTSTLESNATVLATFERNLASRELTLALAGTGSGRVTSSPAGIDCGADCAQDYAQGTAVTLTAVPDAGSGFSGWSEPGCPGTDPCTVTVSEARSVTAYFDPTGSSRVTVALTGSGGGMVFSSPQGITCGARPAQSNCSVALAAGTELTLTAMADMGATFEGWSGSGCAGSAPCQLTAETVHVVSARFSADNVRDLSVALGGPGSGTVLSSPAGISCPGDCVAAFPQNEVVAVTANAHPGSRFAGWSGGGCSGTAPCVIALDQETSIAATFEQVFHPMTVARAGAGAGTVTSVPAGIDCGADCSELYLESTIVALTAAADPGSEFTGWSGGGCSGIEPCVTILDTARSVTATFAADQVFHQLLVSSSGDGDGVVRSVPAGIDCGADCSEAYPESTIVTLTATADPGSEFTGWSGGGCSGVEPCEVTLDAQTSLTASFERIFHSLAVTLTGTGTGRVTSAPVGIDCGADCSEPYPESTIVTLTATADPGSEFTGWSGGGCSGVEPCVATMDATRAVTATFAEEQVFHELQVRLRGVGAGSVRSAPAGIDCGSGAGSDCSETFLEATAVTLTASPEQGSIFIGWSGSSCSAAGACAVTMDTARSVTATFESCFEDFEAALGPWLPETGPLDGGGTGRWAIVADQSHSGARSWFVADEPRIKDQVLVVGRPTPVPGDQPRLRFWHRFDTEAEADGGVLEYSTDGVSWFDVTRGNGAGIGDNPARFLEGGYNSTLGDCCSNPLPSRPAWSGDSDGWQRVVVDLEDFAGHAIFVRWRLVADDAQAAVGWWLDDVGFWISSGCALHEVFADGFESGDTTLWD